MKKIYFLLTFLAVLFLAAQNLNAQVSGTVFRDVPLNGTIQNTYGVKDANEIGVEGVTVTAYPGGLSTVTAADGSWSLATSGNVRIEFSDWPDYLKESPSNDSNSSVRFATDGDVINFGLHAPEDYTGNNADVGMTFTVNSDGTNANGNLYTVRVLRNDDIPGISTAGVPDDSVDDNWDDNGNQDEFPVKGDEIAYIDQTGSIWGLAYNKETKDIYVSAAVRRHTGMGTGGTGAIYKIDNNNNVTTFATVANAGDILPNSQRDLAQDPMDAGHDPVFDEVGRISLGDLDISPDNKKLYTVNLHTKELVIIDIDNPNNQQTFAVGNPFGAACPDSDVAPWGLGQHNGKIYVGSVCTTDMSAGAYVSEFDGANFTPLHHIPLDMQGERSRSGGIHLAGDMRWRTWITDYHDLFQGNTSTCLPAPILSDIIFDENGNMILGFIDRSGMQRGWENHSPDPNDGTLYEEYDDAGETYMVCYENGQYYNEGSPECPQHPDQGNSEEGGSPQFPEYFFGEEWQNTHAEISQGALAYQQGSRKILISAFDAVKRGGDGNNSNWTNSGVRWMGIDDGEEKAGIRQAGGADESMRRQYFGKAGGIGDVEYLTDPPPIEIGNLVWDDTNGNGVQDPGESGIAGVTVELRQGATLIATATTDANGNYMFSSDPNGTTTASHIYNLTQLVAGMDYTLNVPTSSGGNSLTTKDSGEGANPDLNDSDADTGTGVVNVQAADIPYAGANNHSFDIGYASQPSGLGIECWAISDENAAEAGGSGSGQTDYLFKLDKVTGTWSLVGSTTVTNEETVAYDPFNGELYSANGDQLGRLDQNTGAYTAVSSHYGDVRLPDGSTHDIHDVDGLCFDPFGKVIWATERISDYNANDLLFKIDASTHEIIQNAFGTNVDAVPVQEVFDPVLNQDVYDIDDIAVDPETGDLYAIQNQGGSGGVLTIIDKTNGNVIISKGTFDEPGSASSPVDDIEGLTFFNSGQLLASTGDNGPDSQDKNRLFLINKNTAEATPQSPIDPSGDKYDFESLTCLTDEPNKMTGSLFLDDDCNGVYDGNDVVLDGYQINLYRDVNNNDVYDAGTDIFLTSTTTDASGTFVFEFEVASYSDFVITVDDPASIPGYDHFSTTDVHEASFISGGNTDSDNDFGVCVNNGPTCSITQTHTTACNDNGTQGNDADDYFDLTVTGTVSNGSGNYVVIVNGYTSPSTSSGTPVTIPGDAAHANLAADGTTTYQVTVQDAADASCNTMFSVGPVNSCSNCPAINCGTATVQEN